MKLKGAITTLILAVACMRVFAGGFQINEHSSRAMALGGAFTAIADDPSALYFNGAGITQLNGTQFLIGTTLITPTSSFRGVAPATNEYKIEKQVFFPTHVYITQKLNDKFAVGLGFNSPFGLGTKWDDSWPGKYLAIETSVKTFAFNPTVAYKVMDELSVSASFVYSFARVNITKKMPQYNSQAPLAGDAFVDLSGTDDAAFGFHLGILAKPVKNLSIGLSYHSQTKYNFSGTAKIDASHQLVDMGAIPANSPIKADLKTPANIAIGVAYDLFPQLKLSAEYQYVGWSSYDVLKVEFTDPKYESLTTSSKRDYENAYIIRFGADYKLNDNLSLLGGIYYDKDPVKAEMLNPSLVDADRIGLSIGAHYKINEKLGASLSYLFVRGEQMDISNSTQDYSGMGMLQANQPIAPFNGTYNSYANLLAISFNYSL